MVTLWSQQYSKHVSSDMALAREEIFGPVLALMKVETIEEALELANDSEYGLSASIFTTNISLYAVVHQ